MNIHVEVVCIGVDGTKQRQHVMTIQRADLGDGNTRKCKALLTGVQDFVVAHTKSTKIWSNIGHAWAAVNGNTNKDSGVTPVKTLLAESMC